MLRIFVSSSKKRNKSVVDFLLSNFHFIYFANDIHAKSSGHASNDYFYRSLYRNIFATNVEPLTSQESRIVLRARIPTQIPFYTQHAKLT